MRRVLFWQYWHKRDYNRLGSALTPPSNSGVLMQIVLRGAAAGYEAEHTARIFYPAAELSQTLPDDTADLVLAVAHRYLLLVLVRQNGTTTWVQQRPPQGDARTQEYALCRMLYTMLCGVTGIRPPWGMMTGVRPVRIIHDLRAEGKTEEEIEQRFLQHFDCTPRRFAMAKSIADLQRPVLERAQPMDCSVYAGIPFCPSRCSYCSFVSRTVGDKSSRALVAPYVDCLCKELAATRAAADAAHLSIKTLYIGGGTPTSVNAQQLRQLMGTMPSSLTCPPWKSLPWKRAALTVPTKKNCASSKNTAQPAFPSTRRHSRMKCCATLAAATRRRISWIVTGPPAAWGMITSTWT